MSYFKALGIVIGISAFLYEAWGVSGLEFKDQVTKYHNDGTNFIESLMVYGFVSGSAETINTPFKSDLCAPLQIWTWEYMPAMYRYVNDPNNLSQIQKMAPYDIVEAALIKQ